MFLEHSPNTAMILEKLTAERDILLEQLACWAHVKEAGYEPEQVKAFTFRPEFRTKEEIKADRKVRPNTPENRMNGKKFFNCVRLVNDELAPIPTWKREKC
jgi:hypothetical protein